ncbi:hypothetical protein [Streptomyces werraensis]|uniref:hypothetical protein n=1 Tax=Streptomyces werraensis TaxID=68284 RepID=UPI003700E242
MTAVLPDRKTPAMMKVGQTPGSWKYEPMPLPKRDKEHEAQIQEMKRKEMAEHRATFSASRLEKVKALPKGRERDQAYAEKQAASGIEPIRPNMPFDRQGAVRSLVRQGIDKAAPEDVYGRTEAERAELPTLPVTPNTRFSNYQKRQKSALGLTTFGPGFKVKGGNRKKRKKVAEPKARKGFVTELPEHLKKYASA